jgi:heme/copper-type cytochrome/quinol oxidase subunit 2
LNETSGLQSSGPDLGFVLVWLVVGLAIFLVATALTAFVAMRVRRRSDPKRHE